jgi:hypothetical protein
MAGIVTMMVCNWNFLTAAISVSQLLHLSPSLVYLFPSCCICLLVAIPVSRCSIYLLADVLVSSCCICLSAAVSIPQLLYLSPSCTLPPAGQVEDSLQEK